MLAGQQQGGENVPTAIIDHTYADYSAVDVSLLESQDDDDDTSIGTSTSTANMVTFPMRLHMILSDPENCNVVSWMPHGRGWKVFDKEGLENLCAEYFNGETFDDFIRSVNKWGFKQLVGSGPDYKSYYHQYFLRGKPDLCRLMDTTVNTGELIPDIVSEPNLYVISNLYPLPEDPGMPREQESIDLFMRDAFQNEARGADDTY
ncbi:hypothetical protein ACHAXN_005476 [Cyclotella atomus]